MRENDKRVKWPELTSVLVVSTDQALAERLAQTLRRPDFRVTAALSFQEGQHCLTTGNHQVALIDLPAVGPEQPEILVKWTALAPQTKLIALVEEKNFDQAVLALKNGASNFIPKPLNWEILPRLVDLTLGRPPR